MTTRPATVAEIRKHFREQYNFCRISRDGHVEFRPEPAWYPGASTAWLEGRWVSEYRVDEGGEVILP